MEIPEDPPGRFKQDILGFVATGLVAVVSLALNRFVFHVREPGTFLFASTIITPILMGLTGAFFWRKLKLTNWQHVSYSFGSSVVGVLITMVVAMEGIICLVIIFPLIWALVLGGMLFGRLLFQRGNNGLNMSVVAALLVWFTFDIVSVHDYHAVVADVMIINAPPSKVWQHVAAYDSISAPPKYWLFSIGLPAPVATTVDAYRTGARRKCIFSNGAVFDEVMTVYEPEKELTFDIVKQPDDPEIIGHVKIERGQFLLKDNGDGTTTLTGTSWYRLFVFPAWYFDLWAKSITRNVHLRAMEHIKYVSESRQDGK